MPSRPVPESAPCDAAAKAEIGPANWYAQRQAERIVWLHSRADPSQMVPAGLDPKVVAVYHGVGQLLSRFTTGKIPKAFKVRVPCCPVCLPTQCLRTQVETAAAAGCGDDEAAELPAQLVK